ncbi:MAG TPA: neutral zinc metallopeptidase [Burkholderiaceae bacterium]|nr:neutral zinc metallopeptidase [Burkholderiaceae bacterium]
MRTDGRESGNVEDRRGMGGIPGGGRTIGGGIGVLVVAVAAMFFGIDPRIVLGLLGGTEQGAPPTTVQTPTSKPQDQMGRFVSVVLADTEDTWQALFKQMGRTYEEPRLVMFTQATPTACGTGQSAMGPFYCPADRRVYIDLAFYRLLQERFKAPGDFAQAYVIAHEVGHHVQNLLGIMDKVQASRSRLSETQNNALSVRVELQADCFAGLWAHHAQRSRQVLEQGDIEEALRAATAIGDDTRQRRSQGTVVPESFTHGSAAQRSRWFRRGFEAGSVAACNTFDAPTL